SSRHGVPRLAPRIKQCPRRCSPVARRFIENEIYRGLDSDDATDVTMLRRAPQLDVRNYFDCCPGRCPPCGAPSQHNPVYLYASSGSADIRTHVALGDTAYH